jgi:DNA-binding MarR family transcriptional regulator
MDGLAGRIRKRQPFASLPQEAYLNLVLTREILGEPWVKLFKTAGLSESTYNILRILRGCHPDPLPVLEVRRRMVNRVPDVTRLLDRLEKQKLAKRVRCPSDRRIIFCHITPQGLDRIAELDAATLDLHQRQLRHLSDTELQSLCQLLEKARMPWDTDAAASDLEPLKADCAPTAEPPGAPKAL